MSGSAQQRELERTIFDGFLAVAPGFKATISGDWTQPADDPPDVRFNDTDSIPGILIRIPAIVITRR